MKALSRPEAEMLRRLTGPFDDVVTTREEAVLLEGLHARGCALRSWTPVPGLPDEMFAIYEISALGRLALRVAASLPVEVT
jgi:hypothetical protein